MKNGRTKQGSGRIKRTLKVMMKMEMMHLRTPATPILKRMDWIRMNLSITLEDIAQKGLFEEEGVLISEEEIVEENDDMESE